MGYPCPPENQTTLGWAWSTSTMKPQPVTVMEQCFGNVIGPSLLLTTCQTYLVGYITCYPSKYQLVWLHRLYHWYLGNLFGCSSCNAKLIPIVLPLGAIQREARWCKTPIGIDLNKSISIELFIYLIFTTMPEDGALTLDDRKQLIPWSHSSTGSMIAAWLFWPNARYMQTFLLSSNGILVTVKRIQTWLIWTWGLVWHGQHGFWLLLLLLFRWVYFDPYCQWSAATDQGLVPECLMPVRV